MAYLRLLGGVSLEREGVPLSGPETQRHRLALLAILAAAHPHGVQREKLVALLWPERNVERGRNLLNQAVHHLRKALGSQVVVSFGGELRLDPEILSSDLVEFENALDAGRRVEAVERYAGDFLDGFHLGGSIDFERWVDEERARLAHRYRESLEALAEEAEARGDDSEAAEWWRRRAGDEPLNTPVAVRLAESLAATGDVAGALRHLHLHGRLLKEELEIAPPPEVEELATALREGRWDSKHPPRGRTTPSSASTAPAARAPGGDAEALRMEERAPGPPGDRGAGGDRPAALGGGRNRARLRSAWVVGGLVALVAMAGGLLRASDPGAPTEAGGDGAPPSVAVLPFENLGPEADGHLATGITDELTARLTRADDLTVIAGASALDYPGEGSVDLRAVGDELGVDHVVMGTVRWEEKDGGERVRVTPRLVRIPEGRHVWAGSYERDPDELFALQAEITRAIVRELGSAPPGPGWEDGLQRPTEDLEAYDHYLQGNAYVARQFSDDAARAAIAQYRRAVALDPEFVEAWRRLIQTRVWLGWVFDDEEEAPRAREDLERLLELGMDHPEVELARGWYLYYGERRYAEAREAFQAVRRSRPGDAEILRVLGFLEHRLGRTEASLTTKREALELSPRDAELAFAIGQALARAGRYEEAPAYYERAFALTPDQDIGFLYPGWEHLHLARGDTAGARRVRERAWELGGGAWLGGRGELYTGDLRTALERIRDHPPTRELGRLARYDNLADLHGKLGDRDGATVYADSLLELAGRLQPERWDRPRTQAANAGWVYAGLAHVHRGEIETGLSLARRGLRQEAEFDDALVEPLVQALAARAFARAGKSEEALDLLEAPGVVPGALSTVDLRYDPEWEVLRDHPRFQRLLEEEG